MEKPGVVVMACVAGLLLAACTEDAEPDAAGTGEATAEGTAPEDVTPTDTGEPTAPADTASPADTGTTEGTAGAAGDAAMNECETAVREAGGLADVGNLDAATRAMFDACPSLEEFRTAVESQLEGFEDVDLEPYVRTACTFGQELSGTELCAAI